VSKIVCVLPFIAQESPYVHLGNTVSTICEYTYRGAPYVYACLCLLSLLVLS